MSRKVYYIPTWEEGHRRYMKRWRSQRRSEWLDKQNWLLWLAGLIAAGLWFSWVGDLITLVQLWWIS